MVQWFQKASNTIVSNISIDAIKNIQDFEVSYFQFTFTVLLILQRGVDNVKRGRGRSKLTWDESVKRDLKDWNISKEIALDRSAWKLAINVPEP